MAFFCVSLEARAITSMSYCASITDTSANDSSGADSVAFTMLRATAACDTSNALYMGSNLSGSAHASAIFPIVILLNTNASSPQWVNNFRMSFHSSVTNVTVDGTAIDTSSGTGTYISLITADRIYQVEFTYGGTDLKFDVSVTFVTHTISAFAVFNNTSGGGGGSTTSSAATQSAANKSAGAAFSRASNAASTSATKTQIQNRLLGNNTSNDGQASFNGETKRFGFLNGGNQIAMAYGESINRPNGDKTWHSKDLSNAIRQRSASKKREKEQHAISGLQKLGVEATAEVTQPLAFKSKFDVWVAGGLTKVDSSRTGNNFDGDLFFGRSGFDYLLSSNVLIGAFGGYDKGDADFTSYNVDIDSKARIFGSYFGIKLTPSTTGLPVNLLLDGQVSYGMLDYDVRDNGASTTGDFDATRIAGNLSLTAVVVQSLGAHGNLRWLPKIGVSYTNENQDGYTDSGSNAVAGQKITFGQLTFGTQVFVPVSKGLKVFGRAEGQWDFDGIGIITTSTGGTYKPGSFGVVLGGGIQANISEDTTLRIEGASEGIARKNYEQYTGTARIDFKF